MKLSFFLYTDQVRISLGEAEHIRAERTLTDTRSLSQTLLPAIVQMLAKQGMSMDQLTEVQVHSEVPTGYTSYRVVETTARTLRLAQSLHN
jgi:tRNA A37 threonylcarbamoyladenosine modification protein TsaB